MGRCLTLELIHNSIMRELPIMTQDMKLVQELFPRMIMMDDGDTGERRVVDGAWVGKAVKFLMRLNTERTVRLSHGSFRIIENLLHLTPVFFIF